MTGRIKRKRLQATWDMALAREPDRVTCPLCERTIPPAQQDAHHLVPKSRGGHETVLLHRICHRQIHALLTEAELERAYFTVETLKQHEGLARFVGWVRTKPDDFFERTRKSQRLRSR